VRIIQAGIIININLIHINDGMHTKPDKLGYGILIGGSDSGRAAGTKLKKCAFLIPSFLAI
jgi:hypothetical protein